MSSEKASYYSLIGIVSKIASDKTFYYLACKTCKKKLAEEGGKYYCKNCNVTMDSCNVVYMFSMRVEDGTAGIWIQVFGDIGAELLNKTAEDIKKKKDSGEDWQDLFEQQKNKVTFWQWIIC